MTRANVQLAEQLSVQAIAKAPASAEAYAVAAWANFRYLETNYEDTPQRRADLRTYAEKAWLLAPDSINAELAMCGVLLTTNNRPEAIARLRALADRAGDNLTVLRALAGAAAWGAGVNWGDDENSDPAALARLRAHSPLGRAYADSLLANQHWAKGEYVEAEQLLNAVLAAGHPVRLTYLLRLLLLTYGWGDLVAARDFSATLPVKLLLEDVFITHVTNVWLYSGDCDNALATLARTQREMLQEAKIMIPAALFRGEVLAAAGRTAAAKIQWRTALELVDRLLAESPGNPMLHLHKMKLLIRLGDREGAAAEYDVVMEIIHPVANSVSWGRLYEYYALTDEVEQALPRIDRLIARDNGRWPGDFNSLRYDPALAGLRKDPRVQAILARGSGWLAEMRRGATAEQPQARRPPPPDAKSVAVLAFANLSSDKEQEYFSDGISEELLNVLAKVPGLKVSARTSAFYFKGKEVPIPEIAQKLGVAYVVEGSVRKQGEKVRITAQLIKAADGFHVWSDTFTRDLKDIFAVQDEIAGLIAQQLQLKLEGSSRATKQVDPEAYRLVLEGRYFWSLRTEDGFRRAEAAFRQALEHDPQFAQAHAGLADVWSIRGWYHLLSGISLEPKDFAPAIAAAERAIQLDPQLAEPHTALGAIYYNQGKLAEATRQFETALRLNPGYSFAHHWWSHVLIAEGRLGEGLREIDTALRLDPLSFITITTACSYYTVAGRYAEALSLNDRALALRADLFPPAVGERAFLLWKLGRRDEAVAAARLVGRNVTIQPRWWQDAEAIQVLREAGYADEATAYAERFLATLPSDSHLRSFVAIGLGRKDEALELLARNGSYSSARAAILYSSFWDEVRDDPRFGRTLEVLDLARQYPQARAALASQKIP